MMSLSDKKEIWRGMPQETPEQQLWADNYYDAELIPMAQERFRGHYASEKGDYYGLFLLMGPLWELSTFSVALFEPQNVHVFCRKEQALQVKLLQQNLGLDDGSLCCTYIQGEDIPSLYRVMKKQHDIWDSVGRTAIDITGGSALAAPAGDGSGLPRHRRLPHREPVPARIPSPRPGYRATLPHPCGHIGYRHGLKAA